MSKFGHIKSANLTAEKTVEYTMHQITVNGKSPTMIVKPASEINKGYFNALLKRSARLQRKVQAGRIDAATIAENRNEDRDLYPVHVIVGWKDVVGEDGQDVPFSSQDCADFLGAIDNFIFDDLRNFCGTPTNFADGLDVTTTEQHGKN